MIEYQVVLYNQQNVKLLQSVPFSRLEWARTERAVGQMALSIPGGKIDQSWLGTDARLEIWRTIGNMPAYLVGNTQWLIRKKTISGMRQDIVVEAVDANYILDSYMVDYYASTETVTNPYSLKSGPADNVIKQFLRENGGSSSFVASRINPLIVVSADVSLGVSITKQASYENLLKAMQEIAADSAANGSYLSWDWTFDAESLTFNTYVGRRGVDHSSTSTQPIIISTDHGNLLEPSVVYDYMNERTLIRAGGDGLGVDRVTAVAANVGRLNSSPFGRREKFVYGNSASDSTSLLAEASQELFASRGKRIFRGTFADTPACIYGVNLNYGDTVTVDYGDASYDCHLSTEHGVIDGGNNKVEVKLYAEEFI